MDNWLTQAWGVFEKLLPGFLGSFGALLWLKETWPRKLAMLCLGVILSYYAGGYVATVFSLDRSLAGFLVGLFGMSLVDSVFKAWEDFGIAKILKEFVRTRLGLPGKD